MRWLDSLRGCSTTRRNQRAPSPTGSDNHSDRRAQYAAQPYRSELAAHGLVGSMVRRGNPYDNGKAESFMKTLKCEEVPQRLPELRGGGRAASPLHR